MRSRATGGKHENYDNEESDKLISISMRKKNPLSPSAEELVKEAVKFGYCQKRDNSMLAYFFPCFFSRWKTRFFVLVGNYLFRYSSEHGESPKGAPIPIDSVTCRVTNEENCFEVSMIRKVYTIKTSTAEDCRSWVKAINDRKVNTIRENLGHSTSNEAIKSFNRAGASLFNSTLQKDSSVLSDTANPLL